jgi:hypothetical protein
MMMIKGRVHGLLLLSIVLGCVFSLSLSSDVIDLNVKTFEKETQAATGATTGDWLVEFYAPWVAFQIDSYNRFY